MPVPDARDSGHPQDGYERPERDMRGAAARCLDGRGHLCHSALKFAVPSCLLPAWWFRWASDFETATRLAFSAGPHGSSSEVRGGLDRGRGTSPERWWKRVWVVETFGKRCRGKGVRNLFRGIGKRCQEPFSRVGKRCQSGKGVRNLFRGIGENRDHNSRVAAEVERAAAFAPDPSAGWRDRGGSAGSAGAARRWRDGGWGEAPCRRSEAHVIRPEASHLAHGVRHLEIDPAIELILFGSWPEVANPGLLPVSAPRHHLRSIHISLTD